MTRLLLALLLLASAGWAGERRPCCTQVGPGNPTGCDLPCDDVIVNHAIGGNDVGREFRERLDMIGDGGPRLIYIPPTHYACREKPRRWICKRRY